MDKLLKAKATLPSRDLPLVGVASRSSTRRRGSASLKGSSRASLMLTRLPSFRSGRAALRVLTRAHRMHDHANRRRYVHLGFAWIAFGRPTRWLFAGGAWRASLRYYRARVAGHRVRDRLTAIRPISISESPIEKNPGAPINCESKRGSPIAKKSASGMRLNDSSRKSKSNTE